MFTEYSDILDKIPEAPQWLAEIACFGCLTIYKLACSSLDFEAHERIGLPMADAIRRGDLQLCDPPNPRLLPRRPLHRLLQPENPAVLVPP
jgi:hypothetical protein